MGNHLSVAVRCRTAHAANPETRASNPRTSPVRPCTGWGLPGRRVTTAPVRSYRTISPSQPVEPACCVISVALSLGFPPLDVIQHPALWCPDFPRRPARTRVPAATQAAREVYISAAVAASAGAHPWKGSSSGAQGTLLKSSGMGHDAAKWQAAWCPAHLAAAVAPSPSRWGTGRWGSGCGTGSRWAGRWGWERRPAG